MTRTATPLPEEIPPSNILPITAGLGRRRGAKDLEHELHEPLLVAAGRHRRDPPAVFALKGRLCAALRRLPPRPPLQNIDLQGNLTVTDEGIATLRDVLANSGVVAVYLKGSGASEGMLQARRAHSSQAPI